jgi:hypothetical protein
VHEVGTVVFTVSAQFGVPVIDIWALTRGITSYASEIVTSPAKVEYAAYFTLSLSSLDEQSAKEKGARREAGHYTFSRLLLFWPFATSSSMGSEITARWPSPPLIYSRDLKKGAGATNAFDLRPTAKRIFGFGSCGTRRWRSGASIAGFNVAVLVRLLRVSCSAGTSAGKEATN